MKGDIKMNIRLEQILPMLLGALQKLMSVVLAIMMSMGNFAAPPTDDPITAVNPDEVQLTFNVVGDTQVNVMTYNKIYLDLTLQDINNAVTKQDAFMIVGDITENSFDEEWQMVREYLTAYNYGENLLLATGNHDIRLFSAKAATERFTSFTNEFNDFEIDAQHYSYEINGYRFIVMGSDGYAFEEANISDEQVEWLDAELAEATAEGMPAFVILHQPLKDTHGLPLTWGDGKNANAGHVGDQSDAIRAVLTKYENVVLITGHLHTGFGQYSYEYIDGVHAVNVPGAGKNNKDGDYCEFSTGYSVEVYEDEILFRARDYAKGTYVPEYDITIPVK